MAKQILKLEKQLVRAAFDASSFNKENRTVDVVFATETTDVLRYDYYNGVTFIEKLIISADTVRLDRINSGAPYLDNHNAYGSVANSLGKVVEGSAKIDKGVLRCTLQFSSRAEVAPIMQDVADGILPNISVGYNVYSYERQAVIDDETPQYNAIDWEPYEVSSVMIPADINAGVGRKADRSFKGKNEAQARETEIEVTDAEGVETGTRSGETDNKQTQNHQKTNQMKDLEKRALAVGLPTTATEAEVVAEERKLAVTRRAVKLGLDPSAKEADVDAAERDLKKKRSEEKIAEGVDAEFTRGTEITKMVRTHNLSTEFGDKLIADKVPIEEARKRVMDEIAKGDPKINGANIHVTGKDEGEKNRSALSSSMILRSGALDAKLLTKEEVELAKKYRHHSLMDIAKDCLDRAKIDYRGLDKMEIAQRSMTSSTSDFPVLLDGTNRRILLAAYAATPDKWRDFCSVGSVSDFRVWKRLRPGSFSRLDALLENEEYKNKKIPDAVSEGVSVDTFGNTINVTRKMIVNDDLKAFTALAAGLGRAAKRSIEIDVFAYLLQNGGLGPVMADSLHLFDAGHGNLITGVNVPSMASFDAIRTNMASQQDAQNNEYLDYEPSILITPIALRGLADSINGSLYDPDAANKLQKPNIVKNMFSKITGTPRLTGSGYYAFADPAVNPVLEVTFLDGVEEPYMESYIPFKTDGIEWKVRMDYGIDAIETRGATLVTNA